jgi:hypothetical protein
MMDKENWIKEINNTINNNKLNYQYRLKNYSSKMIIIINNINNLMKKDLIQDKINLAYNQKNKIIKLKNKKREEQE